MRIVIDQQAGRLGIKQEQARISLKSPPGNLSVDYKPVEIDLESSYPSIKIDLTGVFHDMGLKRFDAFGKENAQQGQRTVLGGIARISQEGDRMAKIENGNHAIPDIARDNYNNAGMVNTGLVVIPRNPPKIEFEEGSLEMKGVTGGPRISYKASSVQIDSTWAQTDVYILQKPSLEIHAVGDKVNILG